MSERNFMHLLRARQKDGFHVCVGIDTDANSPKFPAQLLEGNTVEEFMINFNEAIIRSTHEDAACYKFNTAFYEEHGDMGLRVLAKSVEYVHEVSPDTPVIIDGKRGDIGNTNKGYVRSLFDRFQGDATTVPPYMGMASLEPFLCRHTKGIYVLVRTSNEGAGEFQNLEITNGLLLYQYVAKQVAETWNTRENCGIVVGATAIEELEHIRDIVGTDLQILIPGVGAQGGSLEDAVRAASRNNSRAFVINASRSVIFASSGKDFADAARAEVRRMNDVIARTLNPN